MTVSRASLDRWIRAWRAGGFDALIPAERQVAPRTDAEVLELAARLKRERPARTAAHIARIIERRAGVGALAAHPATPLRPPGAEHPTGWHAAEGIWPVRGRRT